MNIVHNFQIISFSSLLLLASWGININEANSATVKKFIRGTLETGATFSGTFSYNLDQLD